MQTSNALGEIKFEQIPIGTHPIQILAQSVPLPWENAENNSKQVKIELRQPQTLYLALEQFEDD